MFYRLSPCGGKLGCSAGNNMVVSRQRKFWQNISIIFVYTRMKDTGKCGQSNDNTLPQYDRMGEEGNIVN
jgi:hypothetical protein